MREMTQNERLDYLVNEFLKESVQYRNIVIPDDVPGKKRLLRSLMNIRMPGFLPEHVLFLEIGVGNNTPVIIKYPFWQMTDENPRAFYACLNYSEAYCPSQIKDRSVCIEGDSGEVIREILRYDG